MSKIRQLIERYLGNTGMPVATLIVAGVAMVGRPLLRLVMVIYRSLARAMAKSPGTAALVAGAAVVVVYAALSDSVFVDDVELGPTLQGRGVSGGVMLEQSVAMMPSVIAERIALLPESKDTFFGFSSRHHVGYKSDHSCIIEFPIIRTADVVSIVGLRRAEMISRSMVSAVSPQIFSMRKLVFGIRQVIGLEARQLRPILYEEGGKFILTMNASPYVNEEKTYKFEDIAQRNKILATALIDFLVPELAAYELVSASAPDEDYQTRIATQFLRDGQTELRVAFIRSTRDLERTVAYARRQTNYERYADFNRRLLSDLDFSAYGSSAAVLQGLLSDRLRQADESTRGRIAYLKYIHPHEAALQETTTGRLFLALRQANAGQWRVFRHHVVRLLEDPIPAELKDRVSHFDIANAILFELTRTGKLEQAGELAESKVFANARAPTPKRQLEREAILTVLKMVRGDLGAAKILAAKGLAASPCAENLVATILAELVSEDPAKAEQLPGVQEIVRDAFIRLEEAGLQSFDFFQERASFERHVKNWGDSLRYHERSMEHAGEHRWVLLNWGGTAAEVGLYSLAIEKYRESLKMGPLGASLNGYMSVLLTVGDSADRELLDAVRDYQSYYRRYQYEVKNFIQVRAMRAACRLKESLEITLLGPGEAFTLVDKLEVNGREYRSDELTEPCTHNNGMVPKQ